MRDKHKSSQGRDVSSENRVIGFKFTEGYLKVCVCVKGYLKFCGHVRPLEEVAFELRCK